MKKLIILSLLSLIISSCETIIEYKLPPHEPKLAIDAKLVAGDFVSAIISTTVDPLTYDSPIRDSNFSVWLYEDGAAVSQFEAQGNAFYSFYIIKENKTYKITADRQGYERAEGSTFIREKVEIKNVVYDSINQVITFEFTDPSSPKDYYMIKVLDELGYELPYSCNDVTVNFFGSYYYDDPFSSEVKKGFEGFLSDEYFNNKTKRLRLNLDEDYFFEESPKPHHLNLYRIDEDLYEYEKTKSLDGGEDNPFGEPVQVHSNIINGYGIVGGASVSVYDKF